MVGHGIAVSSLVVLALASCTMENPLFGLDEGTSEAGDGETGDGDGETGDGDGETGDGDGDATCHIPFDAPKAVRYQLEIDGECTILDEGIWKSVAQQAAGIEFVGPCQVGCGICGQIGMTMLGATLEQDGGLLPACVELVNEGPLPNADPLRCDYHAVSGWSGLTSDTPPAFAASALDWGIPAAVADTFGNVVIEREIIDSCECSSVDECCDANDPPAQYKLVVDGMPVYQGQTTTILVGNLPYEFYNVQSQFTGRCEDPHMIGWSLALAG